MITAVLTFAVRGVTRRPLQSLLLLFALSIALAGTMTIMAVLAGVQEQMRRDLEQVGVDVVNVHISPNIKNLLSSPLKLADCDWMHELTGGQIAPFLTTMAVTDSGGAVAEPQGEPVQVLLLQTTAAWGSIVPLQWMEGRFFHEGERDVCVLDEWVAEKLFPGQAAVGQQVRVRRLGTPQQLRVVGVMKDPFEIRKRFDELDVTGSARSRVMRIMEFKSIYAPGTFTAGTQAIHGAIIKVPSDLDPGLAARQIMDRLGDRKASVWVWARKEWVEHVIEAANFGTQIANIVWVIVLVVTGVMIATVSLIAIRERYREIAIRRTEGARRVQVVAQLLVENVLLTTLSGVMALGLSRVAGIILRDRYLSWPPAFLVGDVLLALGMGTILAALATVLPARRAASLDPVEVLRRA